MILEWGLSNCHLKGEWESEMVARVWHTNIHPSIHLYILWHRKCVHCQTEATLQYLFSHSSSQCLFGLLVFTLSSFFSWYECLFNIGSTHVYTRNGSISPFNYYYSITPVSFLWRCLHKFWFQLLPFIPSIYLFLIISSFFIFISSINKWKYKLTFYLIVVSIRCTTSTTEMGSSFFCLLLSSIIIVVVAFQFDQFNIIYVECKWYAGNTNEFVTYMSNDAQK